MGNLRDKLPPNVIIVDLCVYCADCKHVHRVAEPDEKSGGFEVCPDCNAPTTTIIGVHVASAQEELLHLAQTYMQRPSIQKRLVKLLRHRQ